MLRSPAIRPYADLSMESRRLERTELSESGSIFCLQCSPQLESDLDFQVDTIMCLYDSSTPKDGFRD